MKLMKILIMKWICFENIWIAFLRIPNEILWINLNVYRAKAHISPHFTIIIFNALKKKISYFFESAG